jgi:uncharacterized protein YutE (UPF0331/DUF86 family)
MTNFSIIENKISSIKKYLAILKRYKKYSKEELMKNIDLRGAVERYLYLVSQSAIDLAGAVISFREFRKPTTASENFYILEEEKIITRGLSENLIKMVGFRNIIAHDYEKVDYDILYDILINKLKDIENFVRLIKRLR